MRRARDVDTWERIVRALPADRPLGRRRADHGRRRDREDRGSGAPLRRSTASRSPPAWPPWATRGRAPTRRSGAARRSPCSMRCACATSLRTVGTEDPGALARKWNEATETELGPWVSDTLDFDRHRLAEIDAQIAGVPVRDRRSRLEARRGAARRRGGRSRPAAGVRQRGGGPRPRCRRVRLAGDPRQGARPRRTGAATRADPRGAPRHRWRMNAMRVEVNGIGLEVEDRGSGPAVLLLHGWPDSHRLWRHQVEALTAAGFRTIAPDLRGFGDSDRPAEVEAYSLLNIAGDVLGAPRPPRRSSGPTSSATTGARRWRGPSPPSLRTASTTSPCSPSAIPRSFRDAGLEQREKSWYMLLFQFEGVAEQWLSQDDFANLRAWSQPPRGRRRDRRSRPARARSTASLNWYRANLPPDDADRATSRDPCGLGPDAGHLEQR